MGARWEPRVSLTGHFNSVRDLGLDVPDLLHHCVNLRYRPVPVVVARRADVPLVAVLLPVVVGKPTARGDHLVGVAEVGR